MIRRFFEKKQGKEREAPQQGLVGPRVARYSGGWAVLRKRLQSEPGLRVIDVGFTSPSNINYLTSLGQSVYLANLVHDAWASDWKKGTDDDGNPVWDVDGYLENSLNFTGKKFDIVLLWTALDYLPEAFVEPVVHRLYDSMNPGGQVLALFHTRTTGDETVNCRFHLSPTDEVEMQLTEQFPIRRAFTNRSIEKLFAGWSGHRQFLAKDSVSEVIMTR